MTISYDKIADVLYVAFDKTSPDQYVFVENNEGDILKVDKHTGRVVGCTIPSFAARTKRGKAIVMPEIGAVPFNDMARELLHV